MGVVFVFCPDGLLSVAGLLALHWVLLLHYVLLEAMINCNRCL